MSLSVLIDNPVFIKFVYEADKWLKFGVNVCFAALFILSFFKKGIKNVGAKTFFLLAVLSLSPFLYRMLFVEYRPSADEKTLFLRGVTYFTEYFLLSVHADYSSGKNNERGENSRQSLCNAKDNESARRQSSAENKISQRDTLPSSTSSPSPYLSRDSLLASLPVANVSEIPLRNTELIKMTKPGKLNGDYLKQCIFELERKRLSDKDLADFYSLKNDFLFTDGFLSSGDKKAISEKSCRLVRLMALYNV